MPLGPRVCFGTAQDYVPKAHFEQVKGTEMSLDALKLFHLK